MMIGAVSYSTVRTVRMLGRSSLPVWGCWYAVARVLTPRAKLLRRRTGTLSAHQSRTFCTPYQLNQGSRWLRARTAVRVKST